MDSNLYKDRETTRGLNYHYYFFPPTDESKPFIVFVHGFPSFANDWRYQVPFFKEKGFGLIVPDMLGYGATSKPTDPKLYKHSLLAKDIVDILDGESIEQAVFIGHDWGSSITSKLVQFYPERVRAAGFLAVGYRPPAPDFNYDAMLAMTKQKMGYELFGYWSFFAEDGADKLCEENMDIFMNVLYPNDPKLWITDMAPLGALKAALLAKKELSPASWLPAEERKQHAETLLKGGMAAPTCYYKLHLAGIHAEDDKAVPLDRYDTDKPVFVGAAAEDYVALAALTKATAMKHCKNVTVREFKTGHWVMLQAPDEVNGELLSWIESL